MRFGVDEILVELEVGEAPGCPSRRGLQHLPFCGLIGCNKQLRPNRIEGSGTPKRVRSRRSRAFGIFPKCPSGVEFSFSAIPRCSSFETVGVPPMAVTACPVYQSVRFWESWAPTRSSAKAEHFAEGAELALTSETRESIAMPKSEIWTFVCLD